MVKHDTNFHSNSHNNNPNDNSELKPTPKPGQNPNPKRNIDGLSRKERRSKRNTDYGKKTKKSKNGFHKLNNDEVLEKFNFNFSRDAEWYKKTNDKINEVKDDLDAKFYSPEKRKDKIDFIRKLKDKLKDYRDAINFAEKYKKVRFVERRKLERMLTKANKEIEAMEQNLQKEVEADPEKNVLDLKIKCNDAKMKRDKIIKDINYVKFFPKSYKYLSLFPNNDQNNEDTMKKIEKIRNKIDFALNKTNKNKKLIERKLHSIQKEDQNNNEQEEDIEMIDAEEKEEPAEEQAEDEINSKKNKIENKKDKEHKNKNENKDRHSNNNKKSKDKKYKDMKSAYDYELEVLNNHGIENDDFFIVE